LTVVFTTLGRGATVSTCDLSDDDDVRVIESLSRLQVLYMHGCKLQAGALKLIGNLQLLELLSIPDNNLNDADVSVIASFGALRDLNASFCGLSDENRGRLGGLTYLERLDCRG